MFGLLQKLCYGDNTHVQQYAIETMDTWATSLDIHIDLLLECWVRTIIQTFQKCVDCERRRLDVNSHSSRQPSDRHWRFSDAVLWGLDCGFSNQALLFQRPRGEQMLHSFSHSCHAPTLTLPTLSPPPFSFTYFFFQFFSPFSLSLLSFPYFFIRIPSIKFFSLAI